MSLPPPPGSYGSVPPNGGGGQPQQPGQPYGSPYQGQLGGQWGPQQQWAGGPPPNKDGKGKWILVGLALVAIIAVSIVGTVLVVRSDSGGDSGSTPSAQNGNSEFASANDTGPANLITEDPTCASWAKIIEAYSAQAKSVGWSERDTSAPASAWTPNQRDMYTTVGKAITTAIEQTQRLITITPHRVMREVYQQFIAYGREFVGRIDSYAEKDSYISGTVDGLSSALSGVCSAINHKSAQAAAPLIAPPAEPSAPSNPEDPNAGTPFLLDGNPVCSDWTAAVEKFDADTTDWRNTDPSILAAQWTPEEKATVDAVIPLINAHSANLEALGRRSGSPVFEDIAVLSAQYQRAFANVLPNYATADFYLYRTAAFLSASINSACKASR